MKNRILIMSVFFLISACSKEDLADTTEQKTVSDIDGNVYQTVKIGTQVWMKQNIKTTRYSNGDLIGTTNLSTKDISLEVAPKYQWICDDKPGNLETYGRLYTWFAVTDSRKICPTGWHVPTDKEWATLTNFLGGEDFAGGKLKETGTSHWLSPNEGANGETDFLALPAGCRRPIGTFNDINNYSYCWSSSDSTEIGAWARDLDYNAAYLLRDYLDKKFAISVRCIKD